MAHTLREARPEDGLDVARLSYLAGKSHLEECIYDLMFTGPRGMTDERLEDMRKVIVAEAPNWMSYRHYHLVEADGAVASGLASFTVEESSERQLGKALMEAGWGVKDLVGLSRRMRIWSKVDPGRDEDTLIIENVATYEQYRGQGFTSMLLEEAAGRAREAGLKGLQLIVMLGNDPAIRVYERAGFRMVKTREHPKFEKEFGGPGAGRMVWQF